MKKFLLFSFLISGISVFSQTGDTVKKGIEKRKLIPDASTIEKLQRIKDSVVNIIPVTEENNIREDISRNMDSFLQLQKERKAKQKKAAMIRIFISAGLLLVLIIGLRRRKK